MLVTLKWPNSLILKFAFLAYLCHFCIKVFDVINCQTIPNYIVGWLLLGHIQTRLFFFQDFIILDDSEGTKESERNRRDFEVMVGTTITLHFGPESQREASSCQPWQRSRQNQAHMSRCPHRHWYSFELSCDQTTVFDRGLSTPVCLWADFHFLQSYYWCRRPAPANQFK